MDGFGRWLQSTGQFELEPGDNEFQFEIWDQAGNYMSAAAIYSYLSIANRPLTAQPPEPVAGQLPSLRETVRAVYRQILEKDTSEAEITSRAQWIASGGGTVAGLVSVLMKSSEYQLRFVNGRTADQTVDLVYRHMWDRPATPAEVNQWRTTVSGGNYHPLVDAIQSDWYPAEQFGRDAVPGRPVTQWDTRAPVMVVPGFGTDAPRSECLSAPAGLDGVYECGELRVAHALPGIRALNRSRAPSLLYSSEQAHPWPVFGIYITPPTGRAPLTQIQAVLYTGRSMPEAGVERRRGTWAGSDFVPGQTSQVSLSYDALEQGTGVYDYMMVVVGSYQDGHTEQWIRRGRFAIVNRKDSPFGAGWWLAGLERLVLVPSNNGYNEILWVGGDGSTRLYQQGPLAQDAGIWVARDPSGAPDTLRANPGYQDPSAAYVRRLSNGARIYYDATGNHIATVDALDRHTHFWHASGRLQAVYVPTGIGFSAHKPPFRFYYNGGGWLDRVTAPDLAGNAARVVTLGPDAQGRQLWINDQGAPQSRQFVYGVGTEPNRMTRSLSLRGAASEYGYDYGAKLTRSRIDMGSPARDITYRYSNAATRGHLNMGPAVPAAQVTTMIDGPRPDSDVQDYTHISLTRLGGPWRIVDAGGRETVLTRSDLRFPALVTRTDGAVRAGGARQTVSATYNARGALTSSTDWSTSAVRDGQTTWATTLYAYEDPAWPDAPTRVTLPEGEVMKTGYNANGTRAWQQSGEDQSRRVRFTYNAAGLVESVTTPVASGPPAVEHIEYDARLNPSATVTAGGSRTTFANDEFGRTWKTESPVQGGAVLRQETTFYPHTDLVEFSRTFSPALNGVDGQTLVVRNTYDEEGNVLSVSRTDAAPNAIGWVTTSFRYDSAGRKVAEIAPGGQVDSTFFDQAGNAVRARSRLFGAMSAADPQGGYIRMEYDVLNQLRKRVTPAMEYGPNFTRLGGRTLVGESGPRPYPWYPNNGAQGFRVPRDSSLFEYDVSGGITRADNSSAQIRRTYHVNGQLHTDSSRIGTWTATGQNASFSEHRYGLAYAYDLDGRVTSLEHPGQLAPAPGVNLTRYSYHPATGGLAGVTDVLGNRFRYHTGVDGAVSYVLMPGGISEIYDRDTEGRLFRHQVLNQSWGQIRYADLSIRDETFQYDVGGRVTASRSIAGARDTLLAQYSGMGHLVYQRSTSNGQSWYQNNVPVHTASRETFRYDALGNITASTQTDTVSANYNWSNPGTTLDPVFEYQPGTGRLIRKELTSHVETTSYDSAGNVVFVQTGADTDLRGDRVSYYGGDGMLRASEVRQLTSGPGVGSYYTRTSEDYRYDALGRRVLVRTRRGCELAGGMEGECQFSTIRRTVWDSDREFYEIQMPGGDAESAATLESDTTVPSARPVSNLDPNAFFGRVAYTYGLGVDQPIVVTRINYSDYGKHTLLGVEQAASFRTLPAFSIVPLWDARGQADAGVFADDGSARKCVTVSAGSGTELRCIYLDWGQGWFAYDRKDFRPGFWHGTLLQDKRDGTGTLYRRNRYYDPGSGRFTQEDPIGLAGGLNAYGFANGNPVSFSDPYGLSSCAWLREPTACLIKRGADLWRGLSMTEARYYADHQDNMEPAAFALAFGLRFAESTYGGARDGGRVNAALHQYGQCLMTMVRSEAVATEVAEAHEAESTDPDDTSKDRENNARGRELGRRGRSMGTDRSAAWHAANLMSNRGLERDFADRYCRGGVERNISNGNWR